MEKDGLQQIKLDTSQNQNVPKPENQQNNPEDKVSSNPESKLNPKPFKSILDPEGLSSYAKAVENKKEETAAQNQRVTARNKKIKPILIGIGVFLVLFLVALIVPSVLIYGKAKDSNS